MPPTASDVTDELSDWLRLLLSPGIGGGTSRRLLARFGLPGRIFQAREAELAPLITRAQAQALRLAPATLCAQVDATRHWLDQDRGQGQRAVITLADPRYPRGLLETADPPLLLFAMGAPLAATAGTQEGSGPTLWPEAIALVGSRHPTPQGALNARHFARSFASSGLAVVSGLARGIDAAAHEGALEAAQETGGTSRAGGILTLAVVGTGLDRVYPASHQDLARRIAQQGLVLSEYPLGTPPLSENFPRRNRIIAALGRGTLVVEAAMKSGSLITAACALEQGREVFAIPGSIHSAQSRGCHALIKQGAKLVETAQDVLEELAYPLAGRQAQPQAGLPFEPTVSEAASPSSPELESGSGLASDLLQALGFEAVSLDSLQARTGLDTGRLQAILLELELAGEVARLPGGLFQRQVRA